MAGITKRRIIRWTWAVILIVAIGLWSLSLFRGICYAGDFGFFVLTDGYIVIPAGGPRLWGDWGWWVQEPWNHSVAGTDTEFCLFPGVTTTRQIESSGLHLPLTLLLAVAIDITLIRMLKQITREMTAPEILALGACAIVLSRIAITAATGLHPAAPWMAFLVLMPICSWWMASGYRRLRLRLRRYPLGHCECCGYNLFGNTSGRCPECGTVMEDARELAETQGIAQE